MTTSAVTEWRVALVAYLKLKFPHADVFSGEVEGVQRNTNRIGVFWEDTEEASDDVNFALPRLTIRFWVAKPKTSLKNPTDDTPLEQAAEDLAVALQLVPVLSTRVSFRMTGVRPVRDEYAIEARLLGTMRNPATVAARGG